jgi:hypothetical protein
VRLEERKKCISTAGKKWLLEKAKKGRISTLGRKKGQKSLKKLKEIGKIEI